jgi:hypothetical protein
MLADAGDREQALDLLGAAREREPLSVLARPLMRGENHAQARRVDELEVLEVEHHDPTSLRFGALDLLLQERGAKQIKFAVKREHDPVGLTSDIYSKMLAGARHNWES